MRPQTETTCTKSPWEGNTQKKTSCPVTLVVRSLGKDTKWAILVKWSTTPKTGKRKASNSPRRYGVMGEQGQKGTEGALLEPDRIVCVGNRQKRPWQTPRCLSPEWANNSIGRVNWVNWTPWYQVNFEESFSTSDLNAICWLCKWWMIPVANWTQLHCWAKLHCCW